MASSTTPISILSFKGTSVSFSILTGVKIHAPASLITGVILNNVEWPRWNTLIPHCEATPSLTSVKPTSRSSYLMPRVPGTGKIHRLPSVDDAMTFRVMSGTREEDMGSKEIEKLMNSTNVVMHGEALDAMREEGRKGYRIVWTSTAAMGGLIQAEHMHEFLEMPNSGCEYVAWKIFGGWMARLARLRNGKKLVEWFADWGRDLKERAEGPSGYTAKRDGMFAITKDKHGNWAFVNADGALRSVHKGG